MLAIGPALLSSIVLVVAIAIFASFALGRFFGLPRKMAMLIACGNAICGNSAIAAVAPVIDADGEDVAAAIAFTAVLGVVVVLSLPFLGMAMNLSGLQYGALSGLTVYAVPQVIAAAAPLGAAAVKVGTLVKLVRVLLLGPVCVVLAVLGPHLIEAPKAECEQRRGPRNSRRPPLHRLVPWFIIGFILMAAARSFDLLPQFTLAPLSFVATLLTVVSMAALGLGADVRNLGNAGPKVITTVVLSLVVLGGVSLVAIWISGA